MRFEKIWPWFGQPGFDRWPSLILLACLALLNCQPECPGQIKNRDYVDLYDEAVNLYYKPPFRSRQAMQLLEQGCRCNPDHQDLSCYNLGVMREIRGEYEAALQAYKQARQIQSHKFYDLAIQRLDPAQARLESSYLKTMREIVQYCQDGARQKAGQVLRDYIQQDLVQKSVPMQDRPARATFTQPFLNDCLAGPEFEKQLTSLPEKPANRRDYYKERARLDEFHTLFDMELYYRKELHRIDSQRQITATWQIVLDAAQRGQGSLAATALREMFALLGSAGRKSTEERVKAQAMRRAAAVLVDRDLYFSKIKGHPDIRTVIRPVLGR